MHVFMNKTVYLNLSILEINKIVTYDFWYHYTKTKYWEKINLCYIMTYSFVVYIKTENIYIDIAKNEEAKLNQIIKIKKVIILMKNEFGRKK